MPATFMPPTPLGRRLARRHASALAARQFFATATKRIAAANAVALRARLLARRLSYSAAS